MVRWLMQTCHLIMLGALVTCAPPEAKAQRSDTIYQVLFTNKTTTGLSAAVNNIGQGSHQVVVTFSSVTGQTCTNPNFGGTMFFSYDGVNFSNFGYPQNSTVFTSTSPIVYNGTGAYPFVYFDITSIAGSTCQASVYYSGTLDIIATYNSGGVVPLAGSYLSPGGTNFISNPSWVGGIGDGNKAAPIIACNQTIFGTISTGTTSLLTSTSSIASPIKVYICSILVSSDGTGTIQLKTGFGSTCSQTTPVNLTPVIPVTATTLLAIGGGVGSIFTGIPNLVVTPPSVATANICGTSTGANVTVQISYASNTWLFQ